MAGVVTNAEIAKELLSKHMGPIIRFVGLEDAIVAALDAKDARIKRLRDLLQTLVTCHPHQHDATVPEEFVTECRKALIEDDKDSSNG